MSHTSPAANLVWALLSVLLGSFLLFHLWSFDRFKCLKWNNGPYSGAFKRVMTYSYIISVPLLMSYALGFAIIKYNAGFVYIPGHGVVPKPYQMWGDLSQKAIFPLYLTFSIAWSLEMVTHLEELCFWLFLVNAGSAQQDWFRSLYFKTWLVGSFVAVAYMPLVTIFTKSDPLKCEAYTFLAGSLGSLSLTLWFLPILWTFPSFLRNLRREGVDKDTVTRLTKFHELNTLRVLFRFLFVAPLLCLAIDGVRPHQHINESMVWTDLLAMISAVGCIISSAITLVIFFPRSIEGEIAAKEAAREKRSGGSRLALSRQDTNLSGQSRLTANGGGYLLHASPGGHNDGYDYPTSPEKAWHDDVYSRDSQALSVPSSTMPMRPNRRTENGEIELAQGGGTGVLGGTLATLSEENLSRHNDRMSKLNHLVYNFTSPIDLATTPYASRELPMEERDYRRNRS